MHKSRPLYIRHEGTHRAAVTPGIVQQSRDVGHIASTTHGACWAIASEQPAHVAWHAHMHRVSSTVLETGRSLAVIWRRAETTTCRAVVDVARSSVSATDAHCRSLGQELGCCQRLWCAHIWRGRAGWCQ